MSTSQVSKSKEERKFSIWLFSILLTLFLVGTYGGFKIFATHHFSKAQFGWSWGWLVSFIGLTVFWHFVNGNLEWPFHRWILHAPLLKPLKSLFEKHHLEHHARTDVRLKKPPTEVVVDKFTIIRKAQYVASFFPWWTFFAFGALESIIFFTPLQLLFPYAPIFSSGLAGLALSLALYEIVHHIEHYSEDHRIFAVWLIGPFLRSRRLLHKGHHADKRRNEGISGFFTLLFADWVLGTLKRPQSRYEHGKPAPKTDFVSPKPRFRWIRVIDIAAWRSIKRHLWQKYAV